MLTQSATSAVQEAEREPVVRYRKGRERFGCGEAIRSRFNPSVTIALTA